jgi:superfamily II DNA or RNA helicase
VVIADECHHGASATYRRILSACPARIRLGLSGTALDRDDGKNLVTIGTLGEVVYGIEAHALQRTGDLATCQITMVPCRIPVIDTDAEYVDVRHQGIVSNAWRNYTLARRCRLLTKKGCKSVVICTEIEHGMELQRAFKALNLTVPFIHGNTPADEQDAACADLEAGRIPILIASPIFREGVNMPAVDHIALADGGKSVIALVQKVGRGLRRKAGRNHLEVTDFADMHHPKLASHALKRLETFRLKRYPVRFREMP